MKRIGMLIVAVALSAAALLQGPTKAEANCIITTCPAGPNCCTVPECAAFCGGTTVGVFCHNGCCICPEA